jgi:general secretion pathway protein C
LRLQQGSRHWLTPLLQRLAAVGAPRWRMLLLVACGAWVLANLARLVWLVLPLHQPAAATPAPAVVNALVGGGRSTAKSAVDIEAMVAWHLFGEVGAAPKNANHIIEEQVQDTTLNLQLLGLVSASDPALARAVIMNDGRQQQYAIGEQVPGNGKVVLSKVLVDRVILDNNGRYETLWLYDPESVARQPQVNGGPAVPGTVDMRGNADVTQAAQGYRQQLYQNPASLADVIQVAPANEGGKLLGYRVRPGRDAQQFQQFGFKPDDIVVSINGVSLDDPQRALELYNLIRTAKDATFTVRRGDEELNLVVSLENPQ